jgi:hypothetical protein
MSKIAILIANATYSSLPSLECCRADLSTMEDLIRTTGRYNAIYTAEDFDADALKSAIRSATDRSDGGEVEEIFFYFSGHGAIIGSEFFYCSTNFDSGRPNETGLSNSELHTLLRSSDPETVIKVVDACSSGTPLIKSDGSFLPLQKDAFRNIIQISSCLDAQNSLAGDPLSEFTQSFCSACLRKSEGPVYYTDIINSLRDDFIGNDNQTPHFVSQGTGREILTDDAAKLEPFRLKFSPPQNSSEVVDVGTVQTAFTPPQTLLEVLAAADAAMASPERVNGLIGGLFDGVVSAFGAGEFAEFFDLGKFERPDYVESPSTGFVIRVLSKEVRPDKLVTAEITKEKKRQRRPWDLGLSAAMLGLYDDETVVETWDLKLNCKVDRAELIITLTPKYKSLQRLVLVLTCAPSLENCYIFERVTQHPLTDWNSYDEDGKEVVRRWYKVDWKHDLSGLIAQISKRLEGLARGAIEEVEKRLLPPPTAPS